MLSKLTESEAGAGAGAAAAASASSDQDVDAPRAQATLTDVEGRKIKVFNVMTDKSANMLNISRREQGLMQLQRERLFPEIEVTEGLSSWAVEVTEREAARMLDIESLAKDGSKLHTSGSLKERGGAAGWPRTITDDGSLFKPPAEGKGRVYGPMGGPDQPGYPYDKLPLKIKGARELHGAIAAIILGIRSQNHTDKRIHVGETGVLCQIKGHVVYIIIGEGCQLHIHRLEGDVQLFSHAIATGAFRLYVGEDGYLALELLNQRDSTKHGAAAVGPPRVQLSARHELPALPYSLDPLQVHAYMPHRVAHRASP